jgi:hypothetical protein
MHKIDQRADCVNQEECGTHCQQRIHLRLRLAQGQRKYADETDDGKGDADVAGEPLCDAGSGGAAHPGDCRHECSQHNKHNRTQIHPINPRQAQHAELPQTRLAIAQNDQECSEGCPGQHGQTQRISTQDLYQCVHKVVGRGQERRRRTCQARCGQHEKPPRGPGR